MERKELLAVAMGMGAIGMTSSSPAQARRGSVAQKPGKKSPEEVSPVEELKREHGLLKRIVLIYDEVGRWLGSSQEIPADILPSAAGIARRFVEDYHEKLEEDFVFLRFEKTGQLVDACG